MAEKRGPSQQPKLTNFFCKKTKNEDAAEGEESKDADSEEAGEVEDVDDSSEGSELEDSAITVEINQDQDDLPSVFCECQGCTNQDNAYQPSDKSTLQKLSTQSRNIQSSWFKKFPWLSICSTRKKVFCLYRRYFHKHNVSLFSKMGEKAFTVDGFQNWKKAIEKFQAHQSSHTHREAQEKWLTRSKPSIESQLSAQVKSQQETRREGLVVQMKAIQYLCHQGIALQGHAEIDGNFKQLMRLLGDRPDG